MLQRDGALQEQEEFAATLGFPTDAGGEDNSSPRGSTTDESSSSSTGRQSTKGKTYIYWLIGAGAAVVLMSAALVVGLLGCRRKRRRAARKWPSDSKQQGLEGGPQSVRFLDLHSHCISYVCVFTLHLHLVLHTCMGLSDRHIQMLPQSPAVPKNATISTSETTFMTVCL